MSRFAICFAVLTAVSPLAAEPPRVLDDRLKLELFAEQPQIVTPTGIDVDHLGRVWAIESHTHFPPDGYQGHLTDRVLILEDTDGDGRADKVTPFADGLTHAMSVVVKPVWLEVWGSGSAGMRGEKDAKTQQDSSNSRTPALPHTNTVFLATRKEIALLRDTDGDLHADERTTLVRLDTPGNYPHNGLAGIAFDALGWMFFGFGENLGADYKIIGSDGVTLSGGGEGGNIYRCRPDGSKLERWATGFWNPHASCFDAFGRLFTVDNDPDSRPPCRLLHIIPGGDYGYRFRNGRKGTHPFTSWNGEIPGTLPMVSGTGEAPSGILCYESDGFPDDYLGTLLVGTWGDHRIDQFVLEPKGASFTSRPKPIVQGDETFRPVGLALAPDGSVFFTDWVLKDYKLHGKGRVWRLSAKTINRNKVVDVASIRVPDSKKMLEELLHSKRLDIRRTAVRKAVIEGDKWAWCSEIANAEINAGRFNVASNRVLEEILYLDPNTIGTNVRYTASYGGSPDQRWQFLEANFDHGKWHTYDPFLVARSIWTFGENVPESWFLKKLAEYRLTRSSDMTKPGWLNFVLWSAARNQHPKSTKLVRELVRYRDPAARYAAVQWIGEEQLTELRLEVDAILADSAVTADLLHACLATLSLLDGVPASEFEKTPPTAYALAMVTDASKPAALRATALRMLPPATPELPTKLLLEFLQTGDAALPTEAVWTLMQSPRPETVAALAEIVANPQATLELRADAIVALSAMGPNAPESARIDALLLDGLENRLRLSAPNGRETLQLESIRAARNRATEGTKLREALGKARETASVGSAVREAIEYALAGKNDSGPQPLALDPQPAPSAGRRAFFSPQGAQCAKCHTVHGRGGNVGPDLSVIARTMDRQKLFDSIVNPSKEISPQYLTWSITTTGGQVYTGIMVSENGGGDVELGDAQGNIIKVPRKDIDERTPSPVSVMPQGLHQRMTPREFAEVLAYLETLK